MDLVDTHTSSIAREFIAVILAGFGNELLPLSSNHGDEPCPKALLPVGNKPMIDYPLTWLEQSGIKDVLLICPSSHKAAISHHIRSDSSSASFSSLRIDLQTFEESEHLNVGTCGILRHFAGRIEDDFVLLPCDFIPPNNLPLSSLLNKFRVDVTSNGTIATTCWVPTRRPEKGSIPEEWGIYTNTSAIVWDEHTSSLLYIDTPDDTDRNDEEIELRMSLLTQHPKARLSVAFQDSHVYICQHAVLDVLQSKTDFESFREEFMPWLCKIQYQKTKRAKYGHSRSKHFQLTSHRFTSLLWTVLSSITNEMSQDKSLRHSTTYPYGRRSKAHDHKLVSLDGTNSPKDLTVSAPASPSGDDTDPKITASLQVSAVILRDSGFSIRTNNLFAYLEANRHFLSKTSWALPTDQENRSLIDQKAQISSDSMIGDSSKVEERTSIKRSVIGKHCTIGKFAKIVGCVVQDHCVIAEGAKLEGCILGKYTKVGIKAEMSKCITQAGYEVAPGEVLKSEKLDVHDWTAGIESDGDALGEESDDESASDNDSDGGEETDS